jgi:dinuclear metal center YbgI/SA1388 family protein
VDIRQLDRWMKETLAIDDFARIDNSANGLQVTHRLPSLEKIAFAVDASLETFRRCEDIGASALVVHHGLFWGREQVLTGYHYDRIRFLMERDIALYAVHLPLDAHEELGNNYGIAASLGLGALKPFGYHKGKYIGVEGELEEPAELFEVQQRLFGFDGNIIRSLPFGKAEISSVAIVSGGGAYDVDEAIEKGIDLFITGDAEHTVYHRCLESGINVIFAGHYLTEVWGVKLLMERFLAGPGAEHSVSAEFIDIPTGL